MLMTRVEKYKLEEEMAVFCSSVWIAMLYSSCKNGKYRMILRRGKDNGMVELGDVKKQKGKNVGQTKVLAYGEQLELKSGLKCQL